MHLSLFQLNAHEIFPTFITIKLIRLKKQIEEHLQHKGKQNVPICGARASFQLHNGNFPKFLTISAFI